MAFKNLIDDSSTTVSPSTPGVTLDLTNHSTFSRASGGVNVRFKVYASSTVAGDTGSVLIVDSTGATLVAANITGTTARWYTQDGYLPATSAKYDAWYGGNTTGVLTVFGFSLYSLAHFAPIVAVGAFTLDAFTIAAAGAAAARIQVDVYRMFRRTAPRFRDYRTLVARTSQGNVRI